MNLGDVHLRHCDSLGALCGSLVENCSDCSEKRSFSRSFSVDLAKSLNRMTYGVVCFATLFSLVGTILVGIWADQSWGRFWGWDPKEDRALLIVLWNAIVLHARRRGYVSERGDALVAV